MAANALAKRTITLVTGNGGIGYEVVSQLLSTSPNNHVLLGSRSVAKGETAVSELQSLNQSSTSTVELLNIDVTSEQSINKAAKDVEEKYGRLDAIVNNAAVAMPSGSLAEQMEICFRTNATGPLLVVEAFAPLLRNSLTTPRIVNVSSGAGSITRRLDPKGGMYKMKTHQYNASKAALNMITACQSAEFSDDGFKVFAFCPGFTVSNLSHMNKGENGAKPTSEGAAPIIKILNGGRDDENACFLHAAGQYPW